MSERGSEKTHECGQKGKNGKRKTEYRIKDQEDMVKSGGKLERGRDKSAVIETKKNTDDGGRNREKE